MLAPDVHCEMINAQIRDRQKFILAAFRLYVD
jgi:hypothetical protein